jgi:hypothetical protein
VAPVGPVFVHAPLEVVGLANVDHLLLGVHDAVNASHRIPIGFRKVVGFAIREWQIYLKSFQLRQV